MLVCVGGGGPGLVTVRVVVPVVPPSVDVIVDVPAANPFASPAVLIVATVVLDDDQPCGEHV